MKRRLLLLILLTCLVMRSSSPVHASTNDESVADFLNRIYGNVLLYTSRSALENRLYEMEEVLRSIYMVEGYNSLAEARTDSLTALLDERVDTVVKVVDNLNRLYKAYTDALATVCLDTILTAKLELKNFLMQHEIQVDFNNSILDQVFAPVYMDVPPGDTTQMELKIRQLRAEILLAPEYDLGDIPTSWPVNGRVSSEFGFRTDPFTGNPAWHSGVDIAAGTGTSVYAWFSGEIVSAKFEGNWGLQIVTEQDSVRVRYAHLSEILVREGSRVKQGDLIGRVGSTGRSTGPHLHLSLYINHVAVNPYDILNRR